MRQQSQRPLLAYFGHGRRSKKWKAREEVTREREKRAKAALETRKPACWNVLSFYGSNGDWWRVGQSLQSERVSKYKRISNSNTRHILNYTFNFRTDNNTRYWDLKRNIITYFWFETMNIWKSLVYLSRN